MLDARDRYSRYVFGSVLADDPLKQKMEAVLFEFAGAGRVLPQSDVWSTFEVVFLIQAGTAPRSSAGSSGR